MKCNIVHLISLALVIRNLLSTRPSDRTTVVKYTAVHKSVGKLQYLETYWRGEICYVDTSNGLCVKEKAVNKLKDRFGQVDQLEITHATIYKIPLIERMSDYGFLYHAYVVFRTSGSHNGSWWSVEKTIRSLIMQRGDRKEDVTDFRDGDKRWVAAAPSVVVEDNCKMSMVDFFDFLHNSEEVNHNYHGVNANCQHFAARVFNELATSISAAIGIS